MENLAPCRRSKPQGILMLQLDLLSLSTHPNKATELKTSITWLFSTITSNHVSIVSINGKSNVKSNVLSGCTYPTKEISKRKVKRHRDNSAEFACFGERTENVPFRVASKGFCRQKTKPQNKATIFFQNINSFFPTKQAKG